jgi:RsiW-degrading membrane proteinase PrsW (M82 family)
MLDTIALALSISIALFVLLNGTSALNSRNYSLMLLCFILGAVCVIPAYIIKFTALEMGLSDKSSTLFGKIGTSAFQAFIDEFNKYIVIIAFAYKKKEFDEPLAGILITLMIGMGFVTADNIMHMLSTNDKFSDTWRVITLVPVSVLFAIIMGFNAGMSRYGLDTDDVNSFLLRFRGLFVATLFHTFYKFILFMEEYKSLMFIITLVGLAGIILAFYLYFKAIRLHKRLVASRKRKSKLNIDQSPLFDSY